MAKKVFSFRTDTTLSITWKLYADAAGKTMEQLGAEAMQEYVEAHPLDPDQQAVFDAKLKIAQKTED